MLNYIWGLLIIASIFCAAVLGRLDELNNAIFSGAESAVKLILSLAGVICFWSGLMKIAEKSGITGCISKVLSPVIRLIFGQIDKKSAEAISLNISANFLGLANAATPFGLKAMNCLSNANNHKSTASDNMIIFVVINTAALQLIPTTVITLRASLGSNNPSSILPCVWISSLVSLIFGIILAKTFNKVKSNE